MTQAKTALVTGAGRGIGRAIALNLAKKGISVAINDIDEQHALNVCQEIKELGVDAFPCTGDVSSPDSVKKITDELFKKWNSLTILVNNAGIVQTKGIEDINPEDWDRVMAINLRSVFLLSKAVFTPMRTARYGKIINIASVAGFVGGGLLGNACYAASKAGVIAFTKGLAREGGPFGIRANALTPALTDTDMTTVMDQEKRSQLIKQIPLQRAGKPEDIANAVTFLALPESDFITGETLVVDGGFMRR